MRKILYLGALLITCVNFTVFVFGLIFSAKAGAYENTRQESYILDSALTLAMLAREDARIMPLIEAEFTMKGATAGYTVKKLETGGDYIKVHIKKGNEILYREYLWPRTGKPLVIPVIKPEPMAVPPAPAETPAGSDIVLIPTPTATPAAAAAPTFIILR